MVSVLEQYGRMKTKSVIEERLAETISR